MNTPSQKTTDDLHRQLRSMTEATLSPAARYRHVLLMLAAACMGILVLALLLTEPALPFRTEVAFGTLVAVAGCWVVYSAWVLLRRRPLMHAHRVVAGVLASAFSGLFAVVSLTAAVLTGAHAAWLAGALGGLMLVAAAVVLVVAYRQRQALKARRDALEAAILKSRSD